MAISIKNITAIWILFNFTYELGFCIGEKFLFINNLNVESLADNDSEEKTKN